MKYAIAEANFETLTKRLARVENKCKKLGCSFSFKTVGEDFRNVRIEDGTYHTEKFILVETEGIARVNDWEFVATLEHKATGNIVRVFNTTVELPVRFYTAGPKCEHCNSDRYRKDTYVIHNTMTDEFKQVGRSCLRDFTDRALSAEAIANFMQYFEALEESNWVGSSRGERYEKTLYALTIGKEIINKTGFVSRRAVEEHTTAAVCTTASEVSGYLIDAKEREKLTRKYDINPDSKESKDFAEKALEWVRSTEATFGYLWNVKLAVSGEYLALRDLGLAISLLAAYFKAMETEKERLAREARKAAQPKSEWLDRPVGFRFTTPVDGAEYVTCYETEFGITRIYKFFIGNNVLVWKTGTIIKTESVKTLTATIKEFNEYKGEKQTIVTRCKVS